MNAFTRHAFASALAAAALVASTAGTASAQTIGTFTFALAPFCNNAVMTVTQEGSTYRLAGWDDNCGGDRFPLTGTIAPNTNGTLNISFVVVRTSGVTVSTSIRNFTVGGYVGDWTDSAGNSGTSGIVGLSAPAQGSTPRPAPSSTVPSNSVTSVNIVNNSIEAADVNNTQIQLRVTGTCAAGSFIRSIDANGAVVCGSGPTTLTVEEGIGGAFTTCADLAVLNVGTFTTNGTLSCTGTGHVVFDHTLGTTSRVELDIATTAATCSGTSVFEWPSAYATVGGIDATVPVHRTFSITPGTVTAYLNARALFGLSASRESATLSCTFTPQ